MCSMRCIAPARSNSSWCRRATSPSASRPPAPGIGAFFTPTGFGTLLAEGKETRTINGRNYVLEIRFTPTSR